MENYIQLCSTERGLGTAKIHELRHLIPSTGITALMQSKRRRSLRSEWLRLVALVALPLCALVGLAFYEAWRAEARRIEQAVLRLRETTVAETHDRLLGLRRRLELIAQRPLVRRVDATACEPSLLALDETDPDVTNYVIVRADGEYVCGAHLQPPDRRVQRDEWIRTVLREDRLLMDRPRFGGRSGKWVVAAGVPIHDEAGAVLGVVFATFDLSAWRPLASVAELPANTVLGMVDAEAYIVGRSPPGGLIGQRSTSRVVELALSRKEGVVQMKGFDGVERLFAYRRIPDSNWTAIAGIPVQSVGTLLKSRFAAIVGAMLVLAVLVAVLVVSGTRRVIASVNAIAAAARARAQGAPNARLPPSDLAEFDEVAREFNRMLDQRDASERQLRESEARFRSLANLSSDWYWEQDAELRFVGYSGDVEEKSGRSVRGSLGRRRWELPDTTPLVGSWDDHKATLQARLPFRDFELHRILPDGTERYLSVSGEPVYDDSGAFRGYRGSGRDITARKRAEQRLALTTRFYAALSEVNEVMVRTRGEQEMFDQICRICVEHTGFSAAYVGVVRREPDRVEPVACCGEGRDQIMRLGIPLDPDDARSRGNVGAAVRDAAPKVSNDDDAEPGKQAWRASGLNVSSRASAAFPLLRGGEVVAVLSVHARTTGFFDEEVIGLLTRMTGDVSFALEKRAEQALREDTQEALARLNRELEDRVLERTAQLEAANAELEAFSYSVSHDLRAPLRHVDGFVKLLEREQPPATDKAAHYLKTIARSARKMAVLIDDLLTLSRAASAPLEKHDVQLGQLVNEIVNDLRPECADRSIEWRIGALPTVRGDRALLRIMLQNLLANAVKYSRASDPAVIEVGAEPAAGGEAAVYVRDNGVGFDMHHRHRLFGVFQRLHSDEQFEGTGVGLATARRIVHRHGGRIWAESEPGQGATFWFTLERSSPVAKA